ncbi:MAG: hypothetical protein V8Q30_12915 [Acutalibacteraceae bacterium]
MAEGGVHTRTHYFTMVCSSDRRYRFVSKRSQIIDPAQVWVEGCGLSMGQMGEMASGNRSGICSDPGEKCGRGDVCSIISSTPHRGIRCTCMG